MTSSTVSHGLRINACAVLIAAVSGCQFVGPSSIQAGRLDYNEVIQQTSKEQTFANIVRVKNHEPTAFVDVNQISAAVQFGGIAMGGVTNIGITKSGSANLSLQYHESPTVQYQPLNGAALISQLATPITIESLGNLFNSDWPLASILNLAVDRITPGYSDYHAAINTLIALDDAGAVTFTPAVLSENAASKPAPTKRKGSASAKPSDTSSKSDNATYPVLVITFRPRHPYNEGKVDERNVERRITALWCRLRSLLEGPLAPCATDRPIGLRISMSPTLKKSTLTTVETPLLFTRSAYGVLKAAAEPPGELIDFVSEAKYQQIRKYSWNSQKKIEECSDTSFYIIWPDTLGENADTTVAIQEVRAVLMQRGLNKGCLYAISDHGTDVMSAQLERQLGLLRRYLLILTSDRQLPNSYVSYFDGKQWYSISGDDEISQKNFLLIGQLLTIQATTTPPLSLTPTISVGAK